MSKTDPSSDEQLGPGRMIWGLAWPQLLMMFFHFWIGFFDVYVAGLLNDKVQASLGIITQTLFFLLIVAMALSNGAVSAISQSIGAGKNLRATRFAGLSLAIVLGTGVCLLLCGLLFRQSLLNLLQVPSDIRHITDYFLFVYLLLLPVYYLFIVSNAVFRAQKQVYIPLLAMMITTLFNTFGDFAFCFGLWGFPELGFKGLAWATFVSVCCGCLFNLLILRSRGWIKPKALPPWRWIKRGLPYLWRVAWPAGLMQVLWHTGYLVLFAITAGLPQSPITALAAFTAGLRLESILFLPAIALNMTASILVGHYLGRSDFQGAKGIGYRIWAFGVLGISLMGAALWIAAPSLADILSQKPEVASEIINYLHFNILAIPFTATTMIFGGVFIGAGATRYNMLAIGGTVWLVRLPLAYLMGHHIFGQATGIWSAMLLSQVVQATLMFVLFSVKNWYRFSLQAQKLARKTNGVRHAAHFPTSYSGKPKRL